MEKYVPFQVQLERGQHRRLKRLAVRSGRSMGALVRESVEAYFASAPPEEDPLLEIMGMVDDDAARPHGDVGPAHDAYLADAYAGESRGEPIAGSTGGPTAPRTRSRRRSR